ncbi:hypothetical protein N7539_007856 [Penicillium diatomitis]|uniref:Uncharacterized protein n=1 Tax=Penicillium diatomitis TaxID=2819901 RepID=A0A9W9WU50_9EURO|nr:uncharacterized protein N7539_007856 [Penicillium diatomitis]KAJ5475569.1 hypothetical protein N7539_007856 [Penicillium diatomitis]
MSRAILFLTNSELGQCNVALAVAEEFLSRGEFIVHFGSFQQLAPLVNDMNERLHCGHTAQFHEIPGPSMEDLSIRCHIENISHRPGVRGTIQGYRKIIRMMQHWTQSEYFKAFRTCVALIEELRPKIVVTDPIFQPGLEACQTTAVRMAVLWPVPLKDVVIGIQPISAILGKYPVTGSGFPFPIPWSLVLSNAFLIFRAILMIAMARPKPDVSLDGRRPEGKGAFPLIQAYSKRSLNLTPAFKELDFPLVIPDNVVSCGPIVRGHLPLSVADAQIDAWLTKPTILISLGSHAPLTESNALQTAKGIVALTTQMPDLKILWKLKFDWQNSKEFNEVLGKDIKEDRIRIVPWIQADIMSVLDSDRIVAFVHHGGGNSFFEACKVGVPQVILPQWFDTYDCATRVEWIGIGAHGSRAVAPDIEAEQFSKALRRVLTDEDLKCRARAVGDLCREEGRVNAYHQILEFCTKSESD